MFIMGRGGIPSGIGSTEHGVYSGTVRGLFHTDVYALEVSTGEVLGTLGWVSIKESEDQWGHPLGYQGLVYQEDPLQWPMPFGGLDSVPENLASAQGGPASDSFEEQQG